MFAPRYCTPGQHGFVVESTVSIGSGTTCANGRVYLGDGSAEPASYIGSAGSRIRIESTTGTAGPAIRAAGTLPATPTGYMSLCVAGAFRKMPYY